MFPFELHFLSLHVAVFYCVLCFLSIQIRLRIQLTRWFLVAGSFFATLSHNASRSFRLLFWLFSFAVEQHFLSWLLGKKKSKTGREWISGRETKQKKQKLIFCCRSNVQFTKKVYWAVDLIMKTHLSLVAVLPHTQPTSQFLNTFFCDVQFLVCLDSTLFLILSRKHIFFGGSDDAVSEERTQVQSEPCWRIVWPRLKVTRHEFLLQFPNRFLRLFNFFFLSAKIQRFLFWPPTMPESAICMGSLNFFPSLLNHNEKKTAIQFNSQNNINFKNHSAFTARE